ncbi:hypothetical protein AAG906_038478 [Vitis piasezkii]
MSKINKLKTQLQGEFEMKDLGVVNKMLGMKIHRDRKIGKLYLSQKKYIEKVLERFGMQGSKLVSTPLVAHFKLLMLYHHRLKKRRSTFHMDMIAQSAIVVKKIPMVDNHVDMMTKFISTVELKHCLDLIGVNKVEIVGKCLKLYFESIWKVIDSFLIKDILESGFLIVVGNILL